MSKMQFSSVIGSLTVEAFIARGDLTSARERLRDIERRSGRGSADYSELAQAIVAAATRATGS
jgi:hypothetical protein